MFDAQHLARKDWRRIHIDRLKEATLEEWISASEDLLGVADLERDTEHLKDISGLHLLGEAINVGVDRGVVGDDAMADPLEGLAHGTVHFHNKVFFV